MGKVAPRLREVLGLSPREGGHEGRSGKRTRIGGEVKKSKLSARTPDFPLKEEAT